MFQSLQSRGGSRSANGRAWTGIFAALGLLLAVAAAVSPAMAQDELKIVAVVNDDVITEIDVAARLRAAIMAAHLQDSQEVRQQLLPTVMRALIEDHLKAQEAKAQGVNVSDREVNARIDNLARRNNMSRDDFVGMLSSNGILVSALVDQIRADISWTVLVQRKLRPTIRITDAEINEAMARAKSAQGKTEYRLSQIFQAVDSPKDASAVHESAQRLMEQLQTGADFASLAQQFSQDTSAANGGDIGWVRPDEADPAVASELDRLGNAPDVKGRVIGPIQGTGGYYLVRVDDLRQAGESVVAPGSVHLVQMIWPLAPNAADSELRAAQEQAAAFSGKSAESCSEFERLAMDAAPARFFDLGRVAVDALPQEIHDVILNQEVGVPTKSFRGPRGVEIYVVCDRGDSTEISRVAIADRLAAERLETLARGYLSDLRRAAIIDFRL